MFYTWRRALLITVVVVGLLAAGCGTEVPVDLADPVPAATEPTATVVLTDPPGSDQLTTVPAPSVAPGPNRVRQPVPVDAREYSSIRDVDFENGFAYAVGFDIDLVATVTDGGFENGEFGDTDYVAFFVTEVEFGDLNGDGADEAVVATALNTGGTGYFDRIDTFRLVDGNVEQVGTVHFGDRAHGGIYNVVIDDGIVNVWTFSTTQGACCPNEITEDRLVLGDHFLTAADRSVTRRFVPLDRTNEELKFLPGTSSAVVAHYAHSESSFTLEAAAGQRLTLLVLDGPAPIDISVTDTSTGQVMSGLADMVLPSDAIYEIRIDSGSVDDGRSTLEVIIDDGEPVSPISWTPHAEQLLIAEEPFVRTSVVWPEFSASAAGTSTANAELAAFVTGLDDFWIDDVTNITPPLGDSSYEISYEVTLATTEIASVHFDFFEYVCCRPYPNYGQRAVVLDLVTGEIIPDRQILDLNRVGEINALWFAELQRQELLPAEAVIVEGEDVVRFDSLTLVPGGVELGTDRGSLGGGLPGTRVVLTFEQLGHLVNPALVDRIAAS